MAVNIQNSGPVGLDYTSHDGVVSSQLLLSVYFSPISTNDMPLRSPWRSIPAFVKAKMETRSLGMSKWSMGRERSLPVRRRVGKLRAFNYQLNC